MEIVPSTYYRNVKRYWRRRRYQKLKGDTKKKMRVARLGDGKSPNSSPRRIWKLRSGVRKLRNGVPKLKLLKFDSPIKFLIKFHDAYVDMMYRIAGNAGKVGRFTVGKKVAKARDQISVASCGGEEVDGRLVLEIYKRLAASGQLSATC